MRNTLITALAACVDLPMKLQTRRFLVGLSSDELQFIAEYLGACILASADRRSGGDAKLAARTGRLAADQELKLILLREFFCCAGMQEIPLTIPHPVN